MPKECLCTNYTVTGQLWEWHYGQGMGILSRLWLGPEKLSRFVHHPTCPKAEGQRFAFAITQSWAGRNRHPVQVLKETPQRFLCRMLTTELSWQCGQLRYVPKHSMFWPEVRTESRRSS
jgi:hypothetical protein